MTPLTAYFMELRAETEFQAAPAAAMMTHRKQILFPQRPLQVLGSRLQVVNPSEHLIRFFTKDIPARRRITDMFRQPHGALMEAVQPMEAPEAPEP